MKNELLHIAEYIESLEARIAALEAQAKEFEARAKELESKVNELEAQPVPTVVLPTEETPAKETPVDPVQQIDEQLEQEIKMATLEARIIDLEVKQEEHQEAVKSAVNGAPISDLRHAISLGDRFLFQRELFEQNGELMQKTLEALNELPNLDSALAYIDKHFGSWDKDSTAYQLFYTILQRRF